MKSSRFTKTVTTAGVAIYVASALAFFTELIGEITGYRLFTYSWVAHEIIATATLIGFLVGALLIRSSFRQLSTRNREIEHHLRAARGEFVAMTNLQFDRWGLSDAERDIALLTVKGMSVAEISDLRNTSQGTVKSQNSSIYRKAGVKTRTQLLGLLIDELLIEDQITAPEAPANAKDAQKT